METLTDLLKASKNLHVFHHTKAAVHHDHLAGLHEKAAKMHDAHATHHEEHIEKAKEAGHEHLAAHHKASASFHKAKASHHEKMAKAHEAHATHHRKMAEAHAAASAEKAYKALDITPNDAITVDLGKALETSDNDTVAKAAADALAKTAADKAIADKAVADAAAAELAKNSADPFKNFADAMTKAMTDGFTALDKKITDVAEAQTARNALGDTTTGLEADLAIKSFAVARPGEQIDLEGVDYEFADLCKVESV